MSTRGIRMKLYGRCFVIVLALHGMPSKASGQSVRDDLWGAHQIGAVAVSGSTLYVGGTFTAVNSLSGGAVLPRNHLAAIDLATGVPTGWNPSTNGEVTSLSAGRGCVHVSGRFTEINGVPRRYFATL